MELSEIGEWAVKQIEQTAIIRQNDVEIPMFVVMPNHVHLIVVYSNVNGGRTRCVPTDLSDPCRDASNASASNVPIILNKTNESDARGETDARGASLQFGPQSGNLASVVRGIKSAVTKYAIEHDIPFAWQSRYHDHIIRNWTEMNHIAQYIQNNPMKWEMDRFYKKR
ncbi:MAG: hypothetical protein IKS53_05170 [Bacteroidales bacterium]|nr:hypothetical protein [Bacteroidales bacterium]